MAAYAYTIVLHEKVAKPLRGFPGMRLLSGTINVTNFNGTTPVAIAEIVAAFKSNYAVFLTPVATAAVLLAPAWDATNKTVRFTTTSTGVALADNSAGALCNFIAVGI